MSRWARFFRRRERMMEDLDQEIRDHIERETEDNIARGMSPEEARYAALRKFGNVTQVQEETWEVWSLTWLEQLWQDIRFGLRMLAKNPGFTAVAMLTLALGIGVNTAIFSVVDAVVVRPLPYSHPDQLAQLWETNSKGMGFPLSGPDYFDWRAQTQTMVGTTLYSQFEDANARGAGEPEKVEVVRTEANFFSMLGSRPALGRYFLSGEDQPERNHVAVLTYPFWQRHFDGATDAVGKDLILNGEKYAIIGVASASIPAPGGFLDAYIPIDMTPQGLGARSEHKYEVLGRMKPGVSVAQALAEFQTIMSRLAKQYPETNKDVSGMLIALWSHRNQAEMITLLTVVGLVLLIACANVVNLSLVRASGRHQEMAIRNALGAGRGRVVRQLLTESLLLSLLATAGGLLVGWAGMRLLMADETLHIPVVNVINMNFQVLAFTVGVGLLVGILVGLAPALWVSTLRVNEELKSGAKAVVGTSRGWRLLRDALVVGEIAIALALLVGAGLVLRSFAKVREVDLGIQPEGVLTARTVLPPKRYSTLAQRRAFYDQLEQSLTRAPGVKAAAVAFALPLEWGMIQHISVDGRESPEFIRNFAVGNAVTPDYFQAFGIPLLRGRNFTPQEIESISESTDKAQGKSAPLVAIVNQTMARRYWPNQEPVGRVFKIEGADQVTIIGVVGDTRVSASEPLFPQAYYPFSWGLRSQNGTMSIIVKGAADSGALASTVRHQVRALDDSLALYRVRTMREVISDSMSWASSQSRLLTTFALLALVLTAVGIYGVMAYAVTQRTHEVGLRMALGAQSGEILRLVMHQGARIMVAGITLGVIAALALTRVLANLLFGVEPRDPVTFVAVASILAAVALLATYIPARRAAKVDPMVALRHQ